MNKVLALLAACATTSASAGECSTPRQVLMPPAEYSHEPFMQYTYVPAEVINMLLVKLGGHEGQQVNGVFFHGPDGKPMILICEGIKGSALRLVRIHEEAHVLGWRHS